MKRKKKQMWKLIANNTKDKLRSINPILVMYYRNPHFYVPPFKFVAIQCLKE